MNSIMRAVSAAVVLAAIGFGTILTGYYVNPASFTSATVRERMATVKIVSQIGTGSGIFFKKNDILTAAHVVDKAEKVTVLSTAYVSGEQEGKVVFKDEANDIAVVHVEEKGKALIPLECRRPDVQERVVHIGYPLRHGQTVIEGYIMNRKQTEGPWTDASLLDMAVAPGSSGGPVFSANSTLIGLVVGQYNDYPTWGIIVPGDRICQIIGIKQAGQKTNTLDTGEPLILRPLPYKGEDSAVPEDHQR
jgi:S1-C subfamily serine protease